MPRWTRWVAALALAAGTLALAPAGALAVSCAAPAASGGDWPMFGHDLTSTRNQSSEHFLGLQTAPRLQPAWVFDANRVTHQRDNEITGYPIEDAGCIFVGSSTGNDARGDHSGSWVFALNADNGDAVWATKVDGAVYSTVAAADGVIYAFVSRIGSPYVVALNEDNGSVLWQTTVDIQPGSDAVSSPVVYDGLLWVGVSGTAAEGSAKNRQGFEGNSVLIATRTMTAPSFSPPDAATASGVRTFLPGQIVRKLYSIPATDWAAGYAGASQWATISVDPTTGYGYEGTGNPFNYAFEHPNANAVLKIDLDRTRPSFGTIVGSYKGDIEQVVQAGAGVVPCDQLEQAGIAAAGLDCVHLDLDFGATGNLILDPSGRKVLVVGQKSGVVHFIETETMTAISKTRLGVPSPVGGMVGSAATSCSPSVSLPGCRVYGAHSIGGYLYAIDASASPQWVSPVADAVHWGPPVTLANNVLYTVDLKGFLDAYDAGTGAPLLHRPLQLPGLDYTLGASPSAGATGDPATLTNPPLSWGGATVARSTVFVGTGLGLSQAGNGLPSMPDGFVIAFRPLEVPTP